jgi:hypothetical protein
MKTLALLFAVLLALPAAAAQDFQGAAIAPAPQHPELYSFADVVRLTLAGAAMANYPAADGAIRVAATQAQPAAEVQFSIQTVRRPEGWMLLLAGLAAAAWVARRRLAYGA